MFEQASTRWVRVVLTLHLLLACTAPKESSDAVQTAPRATVLSIHVMSGRPQPAPERKLVATGAPVVLQVEGLATKVVVYGPGEARLAVNETPLASDGSVVGTEVRFVARDPGTYRVEQAEAPGTVLALLDVRR